MIASGPAETIHRQVSGTPGVILRSARWPRFLGVYAVIHGVWLVMYALLGKGFAYAGFPPLYVGEMLLVLAAFALLNARRTVRLFNTPTGILLTCFIAWQTACMLPYLEIYGLDALRDSVVWAYALFAWTVAAMVLRLSRFLDKVIFQFAKFAKIFLFVGPLAFLASVYLRNWLPHWPGTTVSYRRPKGAIFCPPRGIPAFVAAGLGGLSQWWLVLILADAFLSMSVRGGLLAFMAASAFALLLRPRLERLGLIFGAGLLLIVAMAVVDLKIPTPKASREFSLSQLSNSVISMVSDTENSTLENTKKWRLMWWSKIWDYTVDGPYFWMGKGYGINLADSDAFQVGTREEPLRSPHSSHVTFLARSGVPGFILWVALQATWAGSMLISHVRARRRGLETWAGLFAWLLAYWIAFMVSAAFDVFFEGPMAGIPFWSLFGLGWGAQILFRSVLERFRTSRVASAVQRPQFHVPSPRSA